MPGCGDAGSGFGKTDTGQGSPAVCVARVGGSRAEQQGFRGGGVGARGGCVAARCSERGWTSKSWGAVVLLRPAPPAPVTVPWTTDSAYPTRETARRARTRPGRLRAGAARRLRMLRGADRNPRAQRCRARHGAPGAWCSLSRSANGLIPRRLALFGGIVVTRARQRSTTREKRRPGCVQPRGLASAGRPLEVVTSNVQASATPQGMRSLLAPSGAIR